MHTLSLLSQAVSYLFKKNVLFWSLSLLKKHCIPLATLDVTLSANHTANSSSAQQLSPALHCKICAVWTRADAENCSSQQELVASCSHSKKWHWATVWGILERKEAFVFSVIGLSLLHKGFTWTERIALREFCSFLQIGVWQCSCILRLNYMLFWKGPWTLNEPHAMLSISQSNYVRHDSPFLVPLVNQGRQFSESNVWQYLENVSSQQMLYFQVK